MKILSVGQVNSTKQNVTNFTKDNGLNYSAPFHNSTNYSLPPSYNFLTKTQVNFGQAPQIFPFDIETLEILIPNKTIRRLKPNISEMVHNVSIPTAQDMNINGWFIKPKENKPVFLFLNGTNTNRSWQEEIVKFFHKNGYGALIPDYRGFADNPGVATEHSLYEDAEASLNFLKNMGYKGNDLALWGYSMGGAIARKIAPMNDFKFAVLDSAILNQFAIKSHFFDTGLANRKTVSQKALAEFDEQLRTNAKSPFDTVNELKKVDYPILFLHSRGDKIVPPSMTEAQFDYAKNIYSKMVISGGEDPHFYRNWTFDHILNFDKNLS